MPDPVPEPISKGTAADIKALQGKVTNLEETIKSILVAMKDVNDVTGRECMPEGEYYGIKF